MNTEAKVKFQRKCYRMAEGYADCDLLLTLKQSIIYGTYLAEELFY